MKKWNWGAFFLPLQFGFANHAYLTFLSLIPGIGWIFAIISGIYGAEWAYKSGKFNSDEEFNAVMNSWNRAGIFSLIYFGVSLAIIILVYIFMFAVIGAALGATQTIASDLATV